MKLPPGHRLLQFESIDSTNSEARRRALAGERGPLWLSADEQTEGRGRLGRSWHSERGNLYATCLFVSGAELAAVSQIGFVAALAVYDLIQALGTSDDCVLKWPNDVLLGGGKVCGLLAEIVETNPVTLAMGFGINIREAPQGLPYATACIGENATPATVLETLANAFARRLAEWQEGRGFSQTRHQWLHRAHKTGTPLIVDGKAGEFAGLAENGALLLRRPGGAVEMVQAGDVQLATTVTA